MEGATRGTDSLKQVFAQQVEQKLQSMLLTTSPNLSKWQDRVAQSQLGSVLLTLEKETGRSTSWDPRAAQRGLEMLRRGAL